MKVLKLRLIFTFCCCLLLKSLQAQNVNIPDANFKNALVNHNPVIDTNGDGEIQIAEANSYSSFIDYQGVSLPNNLKISDLTGIEAFPNITGLNVRFNIISGAVDISNNPLISDFRCQGNQITSLTIGANSVLEQLICSSNMLTSLDISQNPSIKGLQIQMNNISSLDITQNPDINLLFIADNSISNIDVTNNPLLQWFYCQNNNISSFNLTNNVNLDGFLAQNNDGLSEIDIRNGANSDIIDFNVTNNASLNCIYVDDSNGSYLTFPWVKDATATYVENEVECAALSVNQYVLDKPKVFPNPVLDYVFIESQQNLESVYIYDIRGKIVRVIDIPEKLYKNKINLSDLVAGMYFIELKSNNVKDTFKIVKK